MEYIRRRMIKLLALGGAALFCLTGCGSTTASENDITNKSAAANASEKGQETEEHNGRKADSGIKKVRETELSEDKKAGDEDNQISDTKASVPVYGADDSKAVRKYLATLPDKAPSFQEAKKLGIIYYCADRLTKKEKAYSEKKWLSFCSNVKEANEIIRGEREEDIGTLYKDAVVIVRCTVEGDPVYTYVSYRYTDGRCFLYSDASRDRFGGGSFEGSYGEIRWNLNTKDNTTDFYLLKDRKMSQKEMDKMLNSEEGYDMEQLYPVYSLDYIADTIDGAVVCR